VTGCRPFTPDLSDVHRVFDCQRATAAQATHSDRREHTSRIYHPWRCAARRKAAAHQGRQNPPPCSNIRDYFPGFPISSGARQRTQKRRKRLTIILAWAGNRPPASAHQPCPAPPDLRPARLL